jgi:hypothetical protein
MYTLLRDLCAETNRVQDSPLARVSLPMLVLTPQ